MEEIRLRNSAKAIIIKNHRILCTKNRDPWGIFYLLPGGGQLPGETLIQTLKRECKEELSLDIEVGDICFIREYIGINHEFAEYEGDTHQIEFMFRCSIHDGSELITGDEPDEFQIGYEWLDVDKIYEYRLYPKKLREYLINKQYDTVYLGDIN